MSLDDLRALRSEAKAAAQRALALEPNNGMAQSVLAYDAMFEGRPLAEVGKLMDAAVRESPDDWRRGETGSNRNEFLQAVGRSAESLSAAQTLINRDPLSATPYEYLARALLQVGRGQEAARQFEQLNTRWPGPRWGTWLIFSVGYGISDMDEVLAAAPPTISDDSKTCWRKIASARASSNPAIRRAGGDVVRQCAADGRISANLATLWQAVLSGDIEGTLNYHGSNLERRIPSGFLLTAGVLFNKTDHALRADPHFLPLMQKAGIYQYWLDTGTHPDVCDDPVEKNYEVCATLRAAQAGQ